VEQTESWTIGKEHEVMVLSGEERAWNVNHFLEASVHDKMGFPKVTKLT
jgi:hypothetical protein